MSQPLGLRSCACGCGTPYQPKHPAHRYATPTHRTPKAGRGAAHGKAARYLLANLIDGTPCPRCGQPMTHAQRALGLLDAGHSRDYATHGGLPDRVEHRSENRSAGATMGNRRRLGLDSRTSREW